ncbi:hypothetical protein [Caedibacter taeniospiralis]|uniref:hypothetical protein n=1 Tax=Caedibacter taeniospiralis TaxID=28907 RepID=UPI0037BF3269
MTFKHNLLTSLVLASILGLSACGGADSSSSANNSSSSPIIATDILTISGMPTAFTSGESQDVEFHLTTKALAAAVTKTSYCFSITDVSPATQKMFISPSYFCLASGRSQLVHFEAPAVQNTQSHQIKIRQEAGASFADIEAPVVSVDVKVNPNPDPGSDPDTKIAKVLSASGVA